MRQTRPRASRGSAGPAQNVEAATVERAAQAARRAGVSAVARGPGGFLGAWRAAGRRVVAMPDAWRRKRAGFIARHRGQAHARGEPWWTPEGEPTRRHLALLVWAWSPTPARADRWARGPR